MKRQIETADFGDDGEYVGRRDQQAKESLAVLRDALSEGEFSGQFKALDMPSIKAAGRKRMKSAE
ncbi:type II toxin-antitoxin system ParD family antitoxin [Spectribacter hydrogenoxidans]|uniref:Type II toxin-antitoxin system ParD family antitoxin n=1 Tax=Spectribacter hydrogenoxidans TaxID=3075608 RepID=A0ABU3BWK3_9GAMM|nr:type II toxin-antitoxin system ParD family antitoxin [Salinisphaera sp. W335]MDT0633676.1 type II toxin-antitoxin system ParD family antitoxin [Salinisphaera sp. W335]